MVNGPPCAVCGFTLRWLPQQSSWGCDRCQRMFPANGPGAPQQQAAPQQPSPWAPPGAAAPQPYQQQGFQPPQQARPPQQQGFQPPQQQGFAPPQQQGFAPPQQQGFAPPQQQGFAPPQQQGFGAPNASHPGAAPQGYGAPNASHPGAAPQGYGAPNASHPGAAPQGYGAPSAATPYGQPAANPYAPPGAQPYGQQPQQQQYSPHPSTPAAAAPAPVTPVGGKKSSKGLIIALAVAGVAIAGGIVAFVVLRGGGGTGGGGSRSAVVKSTLAALGNGDVDQLLKLSDIPALHAKVIDCSGKTKPREGKEDDDTELSEKDKEDRDPTKQVEKRKKELEELVKLSKGAKIELVEITTAEPAAPSDEEKQKDSEDTDYKNLVIPSGSRMVKGCYSKVPLRLHTAKLKLKVTPKGESVIEQESEITLLQVGKGFWLAAPPAVNLGIAALEKELTAMKDKVCKCPDAACAEKLEDEFKASPRRREIEKIVKAMSREDRDKLEKIEDETKACESKLEGGDQLAAMEQFKDKMCTCNDKACVDKVTQEMTVWAKSHTDGKLSVDDTKKASIIGEQMGKCMQKVYEADAMRQQQNAPDAGAGIGATIGGAAGGDLPAVCVEYMHIIEKLAVCPSLPADSRKSMEDSLKAVRDSWKDINRMPPQTRKTIEDACKQGADAMKQSLAALKC